MAIPDFQSIMLPLLEFCQDGEQKYIRDAITAMAETFSLSDEERVELLDSGNQARFDNRVGWARSHLKAAGLIEPTKRGYFQITQRGKELLAEKPDRIDIKLLEKYPEFQEFRKGRPKEGNGEGPEATASASITPEEALERAHRDVRAALEAELLQQVTDSSPAFFERLVVELLVKMGYGGTLRDAGRAVGRSGDGGIDGVIKEDRLGLGVIYIQAKRWEGTVGRPEVQRFAGALQGKRAKRGVFITTGTFSNDAKAYVEFIDARIALVDGPSLVKLMVDHGLGVSTVASYEVKKIDSDYFSQT